MFTGIVQEVGNLKGRKRTSNSFQLEIKGKEILTKVKRGDSVAVNGVCLTVVGYTDNSFTADVSPETLQATNLNDLRIGSAVNLELAVQPEGFFGGHLVQGHVDGTGTIKKIEGDFNARLVEISADPDMERYMIDKGSVTINGISLTIVNVQNGSFTLSVIPETWNQTNLKYTGIGDIVNIETDLIGKYVAKFISRDFNDKKTGLDRDFLKENGFF